MKPHKAQTAALPPACAKCPWMMKDPPDDLRALMDGARAAVEAGAWFCCHVNMGTCFGAARLSRATARRQA